MDNSTRTVAISTRENFKNPSDFERIEKAAMQEGSIAKMFNDLFEEALEHARPLGFYPTDEQGLGDFWAEISGIYTELLVSLLNECGNIYFLKGRYPYIYFVDKDTDEIDPIMVNEYVEERPEL